MNVYILPYSENELNNNLFLGTNIKERSVVLWRLFQAKGLENGIHVNTIDFFNPNKASPSDTLLVLNHPEESPWWRGYYLWKYWKTKGGFVWEKRRLFYRHYKSFSRRILLHLEPPIVTPSTYKRLKRLKNLYGNIFLACQGFGKEFNHLLFFYNSYDRDEAVNKYFSRPKNKFLVIINSNSRPRSLKHNLFGERLKAIKFFSQSPDFDLYGPRWNLHPKHPLYWLYKKYTTRAWRGRTEDKLDTLSHYKFALAFENCSYPGWVTEKIIDCFITGVIPVYLGAPDINKYIPSNCFIDMKDFKGYNDLENSLRNMPPGELASYREAAKNFLDSHGDKKFTKEYFVDKLIQTIKSSSKTT